MKRTYHVAAGGRFMLVVTATRERARRAGNLVFGSVFGTANTRLATDEDIN